MLDAIKKDLDATGLPWRIEEGKKHLKLRLGRRMVGILPIKGKRGDMSQDRRAYLNVRSQIRRAASELHARRGR